jgi:lanosterol synthase
MQNANGGFASYEKIRAPEWLELLCPAQVFGKIMIEYSYPECTTAVLLGLRAFQKAFPFHRTFEINKAIDLALGFIKADQKEDGSWYGSWGICFTYASFFAVESLSSVGETYNTSPTLKKACDFLVSHQMPDGGWGESYKSCETNTYINHDQSQVVQTAWALLALMAANYPVKSVIDNGIKVILFNLADHEASKVQWRVVAGGNRRCI